MEEPFSLRSTRNHSRQAFRAYPEWRRGIPRVEAGIAQTRMARGRRGIPRVEAPVPIRYICIAKPQTIGFTLFDKISTGRLHRLHRRLHRRSTSAGGGGRVARSWWRELLPPSPGDHLAPLQAAIPEAPGRESWEPGRGGALPLPYLCPTSALPCRGSSPRWGRLRTAWGAVVPHLPHLPGLAPYPRVGEFPWVRPD
jgi:hypothetical protein